MKAKTAEKWTGRERLEYRHQRHSGAEIREEEPTLAANIFSLEVWNREKGKAAYRNNWIARLSEKSKNTINDT